MIGFVYLWMDNGRHSISHPNRRMFCLGSHYGTENDGYITSTGGKYFKGAFKKRPQDFKRRIIERIFKGDGRTILNAEQRWLNFIKPEELRNRYYNIKKTSNGFSREDILKLHIDNPEIGKRIAKGIRATYAANPQLGKRNGIALRAAYIANPAYREHVSAIQKAVHIADPTLGKRRGSIISARMAADPTINERRSVSVKATYAANPEIGKHIGNCIKAAHAKDPNLGKIKGDAARRFRLGTRWINNGTERRQLKSELPIPYGWVLGYKLITS